MFSYVSRLIHSPVATHRYTNHTTNSQHRKMNKLTIFVLAAVALSWAAAQSDVDNEWEKFKTKFNKTYRSTDEEARKRIFANTHAQILEHNSKNSTYKMGHNHLSDMTQREKSKLLGTDSSLAPAHRAITYVPDAQDRQVPASVDYRTNTCLAPVKNQGSCGSCWAFTAIAPLEFSKCKKIGARIVLSEQQLVDCDTSNGGCNGGWYTSAWNYLKAGSAKSASYAYTATKATCKYTSTMNSATVSTYGYVAYNSSSAMQSALYSKGPLAVAIKVVSSFYSYKSGVYSDATCTGTTGSVNHGVVVVGYGTLNGVNHWIVRNSWGSGWGSSGYILMRRGVNMCNIELYAAYVAAA